MKIKIRQKNNDDHQNDINQVFNPEIPDKEVESVYSWNQQNDEGRITGIYGSESENSGQQELIMIFVFSEKKVIIEEAHDKSHG